MFSAGPPALEVVTASSCASGCAVLALIFEQRMSNDTDLRCFEGEKRRFFGGFARFRMSRWMIMMIWLVVSNVTFIFHNNMG